MNYVRLKNLQIGYSIPTKLLKKISFERARIYLSAENVFTITPWKGVDPEKSISSWNQQYNRSDANDPILWLKPILSVLMLNFDNHLKLENEYEIH